MVWFEESDDITIAIGREKQIKAWRRKWKINLVKAKNGDWADLAAGWYEMREVLNQVQNDKITQS